MSGRGGHGSRGGRGNGARGGRGLGGCGHGYTGFRKTAKTGLCSDLSSNVFDYGHKSSADHMRTSWDKLTQYVGTNYNQDICNELQNKTTVMLAKPTHDVATLACHATREAMVCTGQANLQQAREARRTILETAAQDPVANPEAPMQLAVLNNAIAEPAFKITQDVPIVLTDSEKTQYNNAWRTYRECNSYLAKYRGQPYLLILGQCTQLLQDKMKQDPDWATVTTSFKQTTQRLGVTAYLPESFLPPSIHWKVAK